VWERQGQRISNWHRSDRRISSCGNDHPQLEEIFWNLSHTKQDSGQVNLRSPMLIARPPLVRPATTPSGAACLHDGGNKDDCHRSVRV